MVTFATDRLPLLSWTFCTWSIKVVIEENLAPHWGHCSTWPLPLLFLPPSLDAPHAWLISPLNFDIPASAEARILEAALRKLVVHLDEEEVELELVLDSFFLLLFIRFIKGKFVSTFLGPGHLWSGPNLCFKQWSIVQSLHLIVFENTKISLHPAAGHFFFFVTFS